MKLSFRYFIFSSFLMIIGCAPSFDDGTIAIVGMQKVAASTFHKQIPKNRFYSLDDSTRILKLENFLKEILIRKDIERLDIENNSEIKKEMDIWSKRAIMGLLFNKVALDKLFPEDSLKKIYNQYIHERNISVIVLPYTNNEYDEIPNREEADMIANNVYELSSKEDFISLQKQYSKSPVRKDQSKGYWTQLFRGIKTVDREIWKYDVEDVCRPIDDGQAFRVIKINSERKNEKIAPYKYYKEQLIAQIIELWKKPLYSAFTKYTQALLDKSDFYINNDRITEFSDQLKLSITDKDIVSGLQAMEYDKSIGKYNNIFIDRDWFIKTLSEDENLLAHQLADRNLAAGFIMGLISTKLNYNSAIEMGIDKSPIYKDRYNEELATRSRNYYNEIVYFEGMELTEEQMMNYYIDNKDDYTIPPKVLTYLIWFTSEQKANNTYEKIKKSESSFSEIYDKMKSKKSIKMGAKKEFIKMGSLTDPFRGLFTLKSNKVSIPFKRGKKYYIAKVIEQIPPQERSFNEVKLKIQMRLATQGKDENENKARKRLLNRYNVILNEDLVYSRSHN